MKLVCMLALVAFDDEAERRGQPVTDVVQPWEYDAIVSMIIAALTI